MGKVSGCKSHTTKILEKNKGEYSLHLTKKLMTVDYSKNRQQSHDICDKVPVKQLSFYTCTKTTVSFEL